MPQYYLLASIIIGLALLLGLALMMQAAQTRTRERARLARALKQRAAQFAELFEKLPGSYRHPAVNSLLINHLMELHTHLAQLEPRAGEHRAAFALWQSRISQPGPMPTIKPDAATAKALQAALDELYKLAYYRESEGRLTPDDAQICRQALKLCLAQLLADMHLAAAEQALAQQRGEAALHFVEMSLRALKPVAEQRDISERIRSLQARRDNMIASAGNPEPATLELACEGDSDPMFWKKKQVYD